MNNFDFNYTGIILGDDTKESKLEKELLEIKLVNCFSLGFNLFHIIFIFFYSYLSCLISVLIIFLSIKGINFAKIRRIKFIQNDGKYSDSKEMLLNLKWFDSLISISLILCTLHGIYFYCQDKTYFIDLFNSTVEYESKFFYFTLYTQSIRLVTLSLFKYLNSKLIEKISEEII